MCFYPSLSSATALNITLESSFPCHFFVLTQDLTEMLTEVVRVSQEHSTAKDGVWVSQAGEAVAEEDGVERLLCSP
jgi:hypothetical protein